MSDIDEYYEQKYKKLLKKHTKDKRDLINEAYELGYDHAFDRHSSS